MYFGHHTAIVFIYKGYRNVSEYLLLSYTAEEVFNEQTMSCRISLIIKRVTNDDAFDMLASNCVSQELAEAVEVILSIIHLHRLESSTEFHLPITYR